MLQKVLPRAVYWPARGSPRARLVRARPSPGPSGPAGRARQSTIPRRLGGQPHPGRMIRCRMRTITLRGRKWRRWRFRGHWRFVLADQVWACRAITAGEGAYRNGNRRECARTASCGLCGGRRCRPVREARDSRRRGDRAAAARLGPGQGVHSGRPRQRPCGGRSCGSPAEPFPAVACSARPGGRRLGHVV